MKGEGEEAEEDGMVNAMIIEEEPEERKAPSPEFAFTHFVFGQNQREKSPPHGYCLITAHLWTSLLTNIS